MKRLALLSLALLLTAQTPVPDDPHWHDFDFEFGPTWTAHMHRLAERLAHSHTWIDYRGTLVAHKLWNGRGNMSELVVTSGSSQIVGGALHLYDPQARVWSVWFANAATGTLGVPSVGRFENGRGLFYDREPYRGRMVLVRQQFTNVSPHTFDLHQAFSPDNGKTWEENLVINYTR
jgi:hypothetical protein